MKGVSRPIVVAIITAFLAYAVVQWFFHVNVSGIAQAPIFFGILGLISAAVVEGMFRFQRSRKPPPAAPGKSDSKTSLPKTQQ
jgi:hypothetical protein